MSNPIKALRFAIIIGSFMFTLNHGAAIAAGQMNGQRWLSAFLGFGIPFFSSLYCPCAAK